MPGYKTHITVGIFLYALILVAIYQWAQPTLLVGIEWLLCMVAGSIFPDMDVKSRGQNIFYLLLFCIFSFLLFHGCYKMVAIFAVLSLIPMLVRHRGLFHKPSFVIMLPLIGATAASWCVPNYTALIFVDACFFIAGALSHLMLDRGIIGMWR